jgi:PAP2 superfamily
VHALTRYVAAVRAELKADRPLYLFVGCYVLAIGIAALLLGDGGKFWPFLYIWATLSMSSSSLVVVLAPFAMFAVAVAIRRNPEAPFSELLRIIRSVAGARVLTGTFLLCIMGVFYGAFTSAKNMLPDVFHHHWDAQLAKADWLIGGGVDPSQYLMGIRGGELTILNVFYGGVWHVLVFGLTALVALSRSHERVRKQFLFAFLTCWIVVGNILAAIFYSGGPTFYDLFTGDSARFSYLTHSITPAMTAAEQSYLREFFKAGEVGIGSGIAAFPSMHVTAATLIAFLLRSMDKRLGWLGIAFVAFIEIGSVRLGWHYAIDGYVGICSAVIIWWAAGKIVGGNPSFAMSGERR